MDLEKYKSSKDYKDGYRDRQDDEMKERDSQYKFWIPVIILIAIAMGLASKC